MKRALYAVLALVLLLSAVLPLCTFAADFDDVKESAYYYDAVEWARANGITSGVSKTLFGPDIACTRAQAVSLIWRRCGMPVPEGKDDFTDVPKDAYYYDAVKWASGAKVTSGTGGGRFSPDAVCTRGQIITFLYNAASEKEFKSAFSRFTDVAQGSAYYFKPVIWATDNGITSGTSLGRFSPDMTCTRAQIVTLLYKFSLNKKCEGQHDYKKSVVKVSCANPGYALFSCSKCDFCYADDYIKPSAHNYAVSKEVKPGCENDGYIIFKCKVCSDTYRENSVRLGHNDKKTVVKPTCTASGYDNYTCTRCGRNYKLNLKPALGHSFYCAESVAATYDSHGYDKYVCGRCGAYEYRNYRPPKTRVYVYSSAKNAKLFHLSDCGYARNISAKNYVSTTSRAQCVAAGRVPCTHCNP